MKKILSFAGAIALSVALCSASLADVTGSGAGFAVPDNDPAGITSVISIGADEVITDVEVTLTGATHTWIGDLVVSLTSADGTTVDLMSRVGQVGGVGSGDSSDLGGDYTFADGGDDLWMVAGDLVGGTVPGGTYGATTVDGAAVSLAGAFGGESTAGDWTLFISDNAGGDTGSIGSWSLNITSSPAVVPEPGTFALLGVFGVAGLARRRR